jgi:hypothetical protein
MNQIRIIRPNKNRIRMINLIHTNLVQHLTQFHITPEYFARELLPPLPGGQVATCRRTATLIIPYLCELRAFFAVKSFFVTARNRKWERTVYPRLQYSNAKMRLQSRSGFISLLLTFTENRRFS